MNTHHKIQYLFSVISVANIREYLLRTGWRPQESPSTDRLYFERQAAEPGQTAKVWTWASDDHTKHRNQVPNVVFTLSVVEQRPALDIANEIYACHVEQTDAAPPPSPAVKGCEPAPPKQTEVRRCVLQLAAGGSVTLPRDLLAETTVVAAGDVVELAFFDDAWRELVLHVAEGAITVRADEQLGVRLLQGVAKPPAGKHWTASEIVCEELGRLEDSGQSKMAAAILTELGPLLARIDFELDPEIEIDLGQQQQVRRQAATIAVGLAKRLEGDAVARQIVWYSCARLIHPAGLRLELNPAAADELFTIAASDDEVAPRKTLLWMKEHAVALR